MEWVAHTSGQSPDIGGRKPAVNELFSKSPTSHSLNCPGLLEKPASILLVDQQYYDCRILDPELF